MADSKLQLCLIGLGNAGCQAIDLAKKRGHQVFAINSSEKDLSDSLVDRTIPSFLIGNKRGAGKNRSTAKAFLKTELVRMFSDDGFKEVVDPADVVIVTGSTAGGTGSGAGPMLTNRIQAQYPNKVVLFFGVLPKHSESAQAQFNAVECLNELTSPSLNMTYLLADLHSMENIPNDVAFQKTAEYIVDSADIIRGDYMTKSPYGMIDESDLLTILSSPGYMTIYHKTGITPTQMEAESAQSILISTIKNSSCAPITGDKVVRNVGVILNTIDNETDPCRAGDYSELEAYIGKPLATFTNYAVTKSPKADIALILSGLNKPISRINDCTEIAKQCQALFQDRDTGSVQDELSELSSIKEIRSTLHKDRILGISTAKSTESVADGIPDIFDA